MYYSGFLEKWNHYIYVYISLYIYISIQTAHVVMEAEESIQALSGLGDAHPHWGRPSPPIQMLTSSGNTITDTLRNV